MTVPLQPATSPMGPQQPVTAEMATLHALLDASLDLSPEYGPQLSSHLPMALEALHALGADAARMRAFSNTYATALRPRQTVTHSSATLGVFEAYPVWRSELARRLSDDGVDATLRESLRQLIPGAGAAAFHGLIRVGHALRAGHAGELAAALAYWASRYQAAPAAQTEPLSLECWLAALQGIHANTASQRVPRQGLISERMAAWAQRPEVIAIAPNLSTADFPDLAAKAAHIYASTGNFTVLHVVTSSTAMLRLRSWLPPHATDSYTSAVGTALLASGALAAEVGGDLPTAGWNRLVEAAIAQDDDHVIKLVLACRELDSEWPGEVWRAAACRAVGRR